MLYSLFHLQNCQQCLNLFLFSSRTNYLHNFQVRDNKPPVEILKCQFCDTIGWNGPGECLLLNLSDVITRASDLLCCISFRVARRPGTSPAEYLSRLVSSLVCCAVELKTLLIVVADPLTPPCYYTIAVLGLPLPWRCGGIVHLRFLELVGCIDEQSIYCAVTYFSCTMVWPIIWLFYTWQLTLKYAFIHSIGNDARFLVISLRKVTFVVLCNLMTIPCSISRETE